MKVKIKEAELKEIMQLESAEFPKYVSSFINLVNNFAQGTRPKVVGKMTELIKEFGGRKGFDWKRWYSQKKPEAINNATEKIWQMLQSVKCNINGIDKAMIKDWVRDLIFVKTFIGLRCEEAILRKGAESLGVEFRFSTPEEESKGIDGYIGNLAVSIKPESYKSKAALPEQISAKMIFYKKIKSGIEVDFGDLIP